MPNVARINDLFIGSVHHGQLCCPHFVSGNFIQGAVKTSANSSSIVRVGDLGVSNNPHNPLGTVITGGINIVEGCSVHRLGDKVDLGGGGIGDTVQASPNVLSK